MEKKPSYIGETAAVIAVINFTYWAAANTPPVILWLWIAFGAIFIIDWMMGGIADRGLFSKAAKV